MYTYKILEGNSKECEDKLNNLEAYKVGLEVVNMTMGKNNLRIIVKYLRKEL
jgi:hypothetical protein